MLAFISLFVLIYVQNISLSIIYKGVLSVDELTYKGETLQVNMGKII